jgi:hypothetical protein
MPVAKTCSPAGFSFCFQEDKHKPPPLRNQISNRRHILLDLDAPMR